MRSALVGLVVATLALAGCAGGDDSTGTRTRTSGTGGGDGTEDPTATTGPPDTGTTTSPTKSDDDDGSNQKPTGRIAASTQGGSIPLLVTFTLEGSDPDGDALAWTLDADGDGTPDAQQAAPANLPATYKHNFTAAGLYNATYQLTDGTDVLTLNVLVNATGTKATYTFTADYTGVDPTADPTIDGLPAVYACMMGEDGIGGNWHTDLPPMPLWSYAVTPAGKGFLAHFWDKDLNRLVLGGDTGTVPEGAWEVDICTDDPTAGGTYTFTATAP